MDNIPSTLLKKCVGELSKLPGIGKKTALRLAIHLLKQKPEYSISLGTSIIEMKEDIKFCSICHNISEDEECEICRNHKRNHKQVLVVENIQDVFSIENTMQYNGTYHVLNGVISPMDGIGPDDLTISPLEEKIQNGEVKELILALSTTMEGDTTNFYLYNKLLSKGVAITTIARGVSVGDELEYADEITLGRSLVNRLPFEKTL